MDIKGIKPGQFTPNLDSIKNKKNDGAKFKKELEATKSAKSDEILKGEKVDLSSKSEEVREAKKIIDRAPDVRWDKVEEIKAKIASGTYKVDAEAIAEKFISTGFYKNLLE
ncbi:MAG: flagellar biosynthesis anti-sigma factor FlgM [Candidatus Muiribacteriota bacterium]